MMSGKPTGRSSVGMMSGKPTGRSSVRMMTGKSTIAKLSCAMKLIGTPSSMSGTLGMMARSTNNSNYHKGLSNSTGRFPY